MGRVDGKVAFITGAARGQGRSHAVRLAEEGAKIIAIDICHDVDGLAYPLASPEDLEETVRLVDAAGGEIEAMHADVRDLAALQRAVVAGTDIFGPLDIVICNAGISSFGTTETLGEEQWQQMIDVNLTGVWKSAKAALPHLRDGGSIILTSSSVGLRGAPGIAHYVTAKHGVVGLMRAMAHEYGPRRIRVNCVNPTQVDTAMLLNDRVFAAFCPDIEGPTREQFAAVSQAGMLMPVPWVHSSDVSDAVLFLASDESKYVTGLTLTIDAGAVSA